MKRIWNCVIEENKMIAPEVYRMRLSCGEPGLTKEMKPGQFVNVYLEDSSMLLPRPISICMTEVDSVILVYRISGAGTKAMSAYEAGMALRILAPLGDGYFLDGEFAGKKTMVIGGGIGVPPMIELARALSVKGAQVTAVLGFQSGSFLTEEMRRHCGKLYVATDDGSQGFSGTVLDLIKKEGLSADMAFACGPRPMLRALAEYFAETKIPLQVSLEERMGCGFGACVGCACKAREEGTVKQKSVCKDGPVFWAEEVCWDE